MIIELTWQTSLSLGSKSTFAKNIRDFDFDDCPEEAGIYIFARRFGRKVIVPIYIGRAAKGLRARLKTQFNNHRLIEALKNEKSGERVLMLGIVKATSQGAIEKKVRLAERAHIEHALTAGHPLINIQLTKGPVDEIRVRGPKKHNHPFPRVMLLQQ